MRCLIGCGIYLLAGVGVGALIAGVEEENTGYTILGVLLLLAAFAVLLWKVIPAARASGQEKRRRIEEKRNEEQRRREEEERRARLERQRKEIMDLAHATENIIEKAVRDATNTENSLWLSALLIIQQDFRDLYQEFEGGGLSHEDAEARMLDVKEQAEVLSSPPAGEGTAEEPKREPTYYDILGVDASASQEEIKKAYRDKVKQYHPDIFMNQPRWVGEQAEEMSKKLNEAYEELGDINKRKEYDQKIGGKS